MGSTDPCVASLGLGGFVVDCVQSGVEGLIGARIRTRDAILLELHLPDMSGLGLLDVLVHEPIAAPVVVLTRHADVESAVTAMRLGAADFRRKPVSSDELIHVLQNVVSRARATHDHEPRRDPPLVRDECGDRDDLVSLLLTELTEIVRGASGDGSAEAGGHRLSRLLVEAMLTPQLPPTAFVACADSFHRNVLELETRTHAWSIEGAHHLAGRLLHHQRPLPAKVHDALMQLEASGRSHARLREDTVAGALAVDPSHLGRLLRLHTGLGFREWRRALAMKHAVIHLAHSHTQIAQVAYSVGFDHPSQFDREFRQVFGVTPTLFRKLVESMSVLFPLAGALSRGVMLEAQEQLRSRTPCQSFSGLDRGAPCHHAVRDCAVCSLARGAGGATSGLDAAVFEPPRTS